jgi:hypothetical protein
MGRPGYFIPYPDASCALSVQKKKYFSGNNRVLMVA